MQLYPDSYNAIGSGSVQWPFFKVSPNTLDDIFAVKADSTWETDQFLVNAYVDCKVVRPCLPTVCLIKIGRAHV